MKKLLVALIVFVLFYSCIKKSKNNSPTFLAPPTEITITPSPSTKTPYVLKDIDVKGEDTVFFEDNLYLYDASVSLLDTNGILTPLDVFYRIGFKKRQEFETSNVILVVAGMKRTDSSIVHLYVQSPYILYSNNGYSPYYADSTYKRRWAARLTSVKNRTSDIYFKYLVQVAYKKKGSTSFTYSPYITLKKGYMPEPVIK